MGFRLVPKSLTLNVVMAIILRYFAEFGRLHDQFRTIGWLAVDLLSLSRKKCHKVHQLSCNCENWVWATESVSEKL